MAKNKIPTLPDTRTLVTLLDEYQDMLRNSERAVKKILSFDPETERFWDELSTNAHLFTMVGARSESIWEEIVDLVDQLPED